MYKRQEEKESAVEEKEPAVEEKNSDTDSSDEDKSGASDDNEDNGDNGDNLSLNDDPNVLKSEIDDIRKSIVSMSVGQPGRTSTIVKEWLEQPAPEAPAVEEAPTEDSGEGEEEKSE